MSSTPESFPTSFLNGNWTPLICKRSSNFAPTFFQDFVKFHRSKIIAAALHNKSNSATDSLCTAAVFPSNMLEDISFYHYCCLLFFFSFYYFKLIASPFRWKPQRQKHSSFSSLFLLFYFFLFFLWLVLKIVFVAHSQSFQLYSRVIKANNDAWMLSGWDLTVSTISHFILFHANNKDVEKKLKARRHKWMLYNSESAWCFYFLLLASPLSLSLLQNIFPLQKRHSNNVRRRVAPHLQKMLITSVIMNVYH